jgi:hypothetical protein
MSVRSLPRNSVPAAEIGVAVSVHLYPLGSWMARPSTHHVRSRDAAMPCRASRPARPPRPGPPKVAEVAVFRVFFEHLYTCVKGVGNGDINIRDSSSAIPPIVAHLCSLQERSDDSRHAAAPAVHRFVLVLTLVILDGACTGSSLETRYRLVFQRTNSLRDREILKRRNVPRQRGASNDPGSTWTMRAFDLRPGRTRNCYPALNPVCFFALRPPNKAFESTSIEALPPYRTWLPSATFGFSLASRRVSPATRRARGAD